MKINDILSLILLIIISCSFVLAQEQEFTKANDHYNKNQFGQAIKSYESILAEGHISDDLYYNLANAYLENNELAKAILNFERAIKLNKGHKSAKANLILANQSIETDITEIPDFFVSKWWRSLAHVFSSLIWGVIGIFFLILALFGLRKWLMDEEVTAKKTGFTLLIMGLVLAFITNCLAYTEYSKEQSKEAAIAMQDEIILKSAPDHRSEDVFTISQGVKLKLLDKIEEWYKVELADREVGWINESQLTII